MRLKFWKQPDYFDEIPRIKKPETLSSLSEKLIMKRMKQDVEYGLQVAERVKKVAKVEDKSLLSQVKELRQIQAALRELGVGEEGQPGMLGGLLDRNTIQTILATIVQALSKQPQLQQPPQQEQIAQPEQPQLTQPTDETIPMPSLGELLPYLEMPAEDVVALLKERQQAGDQQAVLWLNLLSRSSYRQICTLLRPVQEQNPELIADLLHESREKWWRQLLEGAKRAV